jgi:alpha-amylase
MTCVCLCFHVHQPTWLRRYSVFSNDHAYFDHPRTEAHIRRIVRRSYLPAGRLLLELVRRYEGRFRFSLCISGVALEQLEQYAPDVVRLFQHLSETGCVELVGVPYDYSLACLYSLEEAAEQIEAHRMRVEEVFDQDPRVLCMPALAYNDQIGAWAAEAGFTGMLCEGVERYLPNSGAGVAYHAAEASKLSLLVRNAALSDDIGWRFSDRSWPGWPLTSEAVLRMLRFAEQRDQLVNLFFDLEALGERHWQETGIFTFVESLAGKLLATRQDRFSTVTEAVISHAAVGPYAVPDTVSWSSPGQNLAPWLGNAMQSNAVSDLFQLESRVKEQGDEQLLRDWRSLQAIDHLLQMSTAAEETVGRAKGDSPYDSPYDAYISFMNILDDLAARVGADSWAAAG